MPGFGHWQQSVLVVLRAAENLPNSRPHTTNMLLCVEGPPKNKRQRGGRLRGLFSLVEQGYVEEYPCKTPMGKPYNAFRLTEKGASYLARKRDEVRWRREVSASIPDEPTGPPPKRQTDIFDIIGSNAGIS